jgi:quercetin dioxygenase-like cupin family protein
MSLKIDAMKERVLGDPRAVFDPNRWEIGHHFADGLYAKEINLLAGSEVIQHSHDYDHLSIFTGLIELTVDDETKILSASTPRCLVIKKGKHHGIKAITNVTWYCIHHEETALWP